MNQVTTFCHVCGRPVKLTKAGKYRRHGWKQSANNKNIAGEFLGGAFTLTQTKRPCRASGEVRVEVSVLKLASFK